MELFLFLKKTIINFFFNYSDTLHFLEEGPTYPISKIWSLLVLSTENDSLVKVEGCLQALTVRDGERDLGLMETIQVHGDGKNSLCLRSRNSWRDFSKGKALSFSVCSFREGSKQRGISVFDAKSMASKRKSRFQGGGF